MPCRSDYMQSTGYETGMSQVYCLLDEIEGKPFNKTHWEGYHPKAYMNSSNQKQHDKATKKLCLFCQKNDVTKYSLEMQLWWRDHQKADKERVEKEMKELQEKKDKKKALAKLSKYERKLLGLK